MAALSKVVFAPQRLTASIKAANVVSFRAAAADAKARRHNTSKSDVVMPPTTDEAAVLVGTGLQSMFERGRRGGYEIVPGGSKKGTTFKIRESSSKSKVLSFKGAGGDGGVAASAVGGPMRAYPAMGPAGRDWASGGYQSVARSKLAAAGFGAFR